MHNLLAKHREQRATAEAEGDKGFTLIELLVVVVILGVLIAIAIPVYLNYRRGANDAAAQSDLRNAINVLELCQADNGSYPPDDKMSLQDGGGTAGKCDRVITISSGTQLLYRSTKEGKTYVITDTNADGVLTEP